MCENKCNNESVNGIFDSYRTERRN